MRETTPPTSGTLVNIGAVPWSRDDMRAHLRQFAELYARRPISDNTGGMSSAHLFLMWYVLRFLRPRTIIESGVWRGQGTWFIERACPDAELFCIDINWRNLRYRSSRATYLSTDFSQQDWSRLDKEHTLCFFDDHRNAFTRCLTLKRLGFRHAMFEDNYPPRDGQDVYSLKMAFMHSGLRVSHHWRAIAGRLVGTRDDRSVRPNTDDDRILREILEVYQELPPIFRVPATRWGDPWTDARYPTAEPLLRAVEAPYQQVFWDEAMGYTWLAYVRLKN